MGGVRNTLHAYGIISKPHISRKVGLSLSKLDANGTTRRLKDVYTNTLNKLKLFDTENIFSTPADPCTLVEYTRAVKVPMDLSIMQQKAEGLKYLDDPSIFDEDIALIVNNVKAYNKPDSVKYQAALKLKDTYASLRPDMIKQIISLLDFKAKRLSQNANRAPAEAAPAPKDEATTVSKTSPRYRLPDITSAAKRRRVRKASVSQDSCGDKPTPRDPPKSHPMTDAVNRALTKESQAHEPMGTSLTAPKGFLGLMKAMASMYAVLCDTPYAKMSWFDSLVDPYRRVLKQFEYMKYSSRNRVRRLMEPHAAALLMRRMKNEPYKESLLKFVGRDKLRRVNAVIPSFMETFSDLHVNPHLIVTRADLKF
ncbi:bromodomain containing protein, putative [Babesia ovata]|uniref:Bromodomain containing protein, putative n=1 Tax=Babesia ovata TaxID=189622 RepID=A0A2H6K7H6_9APIC|nr:bromodomain containing protein, putative [Babesia ovata]GBE58952.1 bromodomain containing protein, putative [Babesia ovata]